MFKFILALVIGLGIGGAAGFYFGTSQAEKVQKEIFQAKESVWTGQMNECKGQQNKTEERIKALSAELQLNESRPGFVSSATLNAPEFSPPNLETLNSDKHGEILLQWTPVKGAKEYLVTVEDPAGNVITTVEVEGETSLYLNRIPHSAKMSAEDYFVRIASVNGLDREGPQGPAKPVHFTNRKLKAEKKQKTKKRK
jgi:hypothetical protein